MKQLQYIGYLSYYNTFKQLLLLLAICTGGATYAQFYVGEGTQLSVQTQLTIQERKSTINQNITGEGQLLFKAKTNSPTPQTLETASQVRLPKLVVQQGQQWLALTPLHIEGDLHILNGHFTVNQPIYLEGKLVLGETASLSGQHHIITKQGKLAAQPDGLGNTQQHSSRLFSVSEQLQQLMSPLANRYASKHNYALVPCLTMGYLSLPEPPPKYLA